MRARHRKSVYLNIRVTRDLARRISRLSRALKHNSTADTCRELFELGLAAHAEKAEFEAHALAERERLTAVSRGPERPPSRVEQPTESETKVAA